MQSVKVATKNLTFFEVKLVFYASLCLENCLDQFLMEFCVDWWWPF